MVRIELEDGRVVAQRAEREGHHASGGVGARDTQPVARPDQVNAGVGYDAMLLPSRRDLLPRARNHWRGNELLDVTHYPNTIHSMTAIRCLGRLGNRVPQRRFDNG